MVCSRHPPERNISGWGQLRVEYLAASILSTSDTVSVINLTAFV